MLRDHTPDCLIYWTRQDSLFKCQFPQDRHQNEGTAVSNGPLPLLTNTQLAGSFNVSPTF